MHACIHGGREGGCGRLTSVDADLSLLYSAAPHCTSLGIFEGTNRELYASLFQGQLLAVAFSGKLTCCGIIITIINLAHSQHHHHHHHHVS